MGNRRFRQLVTTRKPEYTAATRQQQKHAIATQVVDEIHRRGGRFLQKITDPGEARSLGAPEGQASWKVVAEDVAVEKAKQALRDKYPPPRFSDAVSGPAPPAGAVVDDSSAATALLSSNNLPLLNSLGRQDPSARPVALDPYQQIVLLQRLQLQQQAEQRLLQQQLFLAEARSGRLTTAQLLSAVQSGLIPPPPGSGTANASGGVASLAGAVSGAAGRTDTLRGGGNRSSISDQPAAVIPGIMNPLAISDPQLLLLLMERQQLLQQQQQQQQRQRPPPPPPPPPVSVDPQVALPSAVEASQTAASAAAASGSAADSQSDAGQRPKKSRGKRKPPPSSTSATPPPGADPPTEEEDAKPPAKTPKRDRRDGN